jgi:hypothetical protein
VQLIDFIYKSTANLLFAELGQGTDGGFAGNALLCPATTMLQG